MIEWVGRADRLCIPGGLGHALHASDGGCAVPSAAGRGETLRVLIRQILFTGVDALPVTSVIALLLGIIIVTQAGTQLPRLGAGGLVGKSSWSR